MSSAQSRMEDVILEEIQSTCEIILKRAKEHSGKISVAGLFGPAINNVTWRVVSGRQSKQSDPHLIELVKAVRKLFAFCQTDELHKALQFNSVAFCKLCNWFGMKDNLISLVSSVQDVLWQDAEEGTKDSVGSFIDRHYFMQEQNADNHQSIFHKDYSMGQLKGALWDLFLGGILSLCTQLKQYYFILNTLCFQGQNFYKSKIFFYNGGI